MTVTTTYARQIETARRVIVAKGEACKLQRTAATQPGAPAKPWIEGAGAPSEYNCAVLWLEANRQYQELFKALQGTDLTDGQRTGLLVFNDPTVGIVPTRGDKLQRSDNSIVGIDACDPLSPNGTEYVLFTLRFHK